MKRKFLSVLFVLSLLVCVFALSACQDDHEHTFTNYISDGNATCTVDGTKTAKCDGCDVTDTIQDAGSAKHSFGTYIEEVPATCSSEGVLGHYTCSACNKNFNSAYAELTTLTIEKLTHNYTAATCTAPKTCSVCGATDGTALGHTWDDPTCTSPKTCTVCEATEGAALNHDWVEASCTEPKHCSRCPVTEGTALGHTWDEATCEDPKTCSVCNATEGTALGHTWDEATCEDPKTCSVCNATEGTALGHTWNEATCEDPKTCSVCRATEGIALGHIGGEATCESLAVCDRCRNEYGSLKAHTWVESTCMEKRHCSACNKIDESSSLLNHTWVNATCTAPKTCSVCNTTEGTELGHTWTNADCENPKKCSVCQATEGDPLPHVGGTATCKDLAICTRCEEPYGELAGHTWAGASCTAPDTCSVCGATQGSKLGHNYQNYISDGNATCTEDGTKTGHCTRCGAGDTVTDEGSAGHRYGTWVPKVDATCASEGTKGYFPCQGCSKKFDADYNVIEDLTIPKPHNVVTDEAVAATCTDKGLTEGSHCSLCGETIVAQEETPALGHTEVIDAAVAPSCTEDGLKAGKHCSVCNEILTPQVTDPALGHNETSSVTTEASCNAEGTRTVTCTRCDYSRTESIPKLTHIPGAQATCTKDQTCTLCGHVIEEARGHNYVKTVIAPTCTEEGYTENECSVCRDKYESDYNAALGHRIAKETFLAQEPTVEHGENCKVTKTYTVNCPHCRKDVTNDVVSYEHKIVTTVKTAAKCNEDGVIAETCSVCQNYYQEKSYSNPDAHNWIADGDTGNVTSTCSHCNETKTTFIASGSIPSNDLQNADEVELDNATLTMDSDVKNQLSGGGNVDITVKPVEDEEKENALKNTGFSEEQIANFGTIYDFKLSTTESGLIPDFEGYITITLPYELGPNDDIDNIAVYYIGDDGTVETFRATYANGAITFKTKHFSKYVPTKLTPEERCEKFGHTEETQTKDATCTSDGYTVTVCTRCGVETKKDIIPAIPHSYKVTSTTDAGCTQHGEKVYTCEHCNSTYTEKIAATGHSYKNTETQAPTCESYGFTKYECENCDASYMDYTSQLPHTYTESVVEATCTSYGYVKKTCTGCNAEHTTITPATGHSFSAESTVEPTCTKQGYTVYKCSSCDKQQRDDYVPANGHSYEEFQVVEATCISQGYTVYKCPDCQSTYRGSLVPVTGHTYTDTVTAPTCETEGYTSRVCEVCGHTATTDIVAPLGHSYNQTVTAPTCTAGGYTTYECSVCDYSYTGNRTPALGHDYIRTVTAPACESGGYTLVSCSRCNNSYLENETDALGHDYIETVTAPTCTTGGYTEHVCGRCDAFYTDEETEPTGHNWVEATCTSAAYCHACGTIDGDALGHIWTPATCTKAEFCSRCNIEKGEPLGHQLLDATCTEPKRCSRCDYTEGNALGHTWTPATCTAPKTCSVCQATEGEALGHKWVDATCTKPKTCSVCKAAEGEPLGHTWIDATCTTPKTCSVCKATEGEALGHTWIDATCTAPKTCSACQATEGEALGHTWVDATCTTPKTCSACQATEGTALGHAWVDATCTTPKTCSVCQATEGTALGHAWVAATCTTPKTCSACQATEGTALGHTWVDATCTTPKTCSACQATEGEALGHNFENGSCTVCGTADGSIGECTHELTERTYINLEDYGVCGGYFYVISCKCGQNKTVDMEDGNTEACDINATLPEMGEDENGNMYMLMDVSCSKCNTQFYTYMTVTEDGCLQTTTGTLRITAPNGTVIIDCPITESYEIHSETEEKELSLSELGLACGGTISCRVCKDCGKPTSFYSIDMGCSEEELSVTQSTNVPDYMMEDESLMEIGVLYYMQTTEKHEACGLEVIQYMSALRETSCKFSYTESVVVKIGGIVVFEYEDAFSEVEHDCEYDYEFLGEGEPDCTNGVRVTETCKNCSYKYIDTTTNHRSNEEEEIVISACPNGFKIYVQTCPCGKVSDVSTNHQCMTSNSIYSSYVDDNNISHNVYMSLYECGITQIRDSYSVFASACDYTIYTNIKLLLGEEILFEANEVELYEIHSYKYEYQFHGEIDCEAGYDRIGTCQNCGKDVIEKNLYWHEEQRETVELSQYGICKGGQIEIMTCACGKMSDAFVKLDCHYSSSATETVTDSLGIVHQITTVTCSECSVILTTDVYNTVTEGCTTVSDIKYTLIINGKTVKEVNSKVTDSNHEYTVEYKFKDPSNPNCEDGLEAIYSCKYCDSGYTLYTSSHNTERFEEKLENSPCSNIMIIRYTCPCGKESNIEVKHGCSSSYTYSSEPDSSGIIHYVQKWEYVCGLIETGDSYEVYSGCSGISYETYRILYNDAVIYEFSSQREVEEHEFEYEYIFYSGNDCESGYDMIGTCMRCGEIRTERELYGHQHEEDCKEPTCTESGYRKYYCPACGYVHFENSMPPNGHDYVDGKCSICGEAESGSGSDADFESYKQNISKELSVQWKDLTAKFDITETQRACYEQYRTNLEYANTIEEVENWRTQIEMFFDEIRKSGNEGGEITPPVCEHSYTVLNEEPATCERDGFRTYVCQNCDDTYEETIPAVKHNFINGVCDMCGAQNGEITPPEYCVHEMKGDYKEASCTENGYKRSYCILCQYVEFDETIPAFGHSFNENGVCDMCGAQNGEIAPPVCEHSYTILNEEPATCEKDGFIESICENCQKTLREIIKALGHKYTADNICSVCGAEKTCDHEPVNRTRLDLADYGICGGYVYLLTCECGEYTTMDMEDGSTEDCDITESEPIEGTDENGNPTTMMTATCNTCKAIYYTEMSEVSNGCNHIMSGKVSVTAGDGTLVFECPIYESYESHRYASQVRLDLAELGIPCGGYVYYMVCGDCAQITDLGDYYIGCADDQLETLVMDTNIPPAVMEDESLMEIGVVYYMQMTRRHPACGLVITEYMSMQRISVCETKQVTKLTLEWNGEIIFEAESTYHGAEHSYTYNCKFDSEENCESGVKVTAICNNCKDSYTFTTYQHNTMITETITCEDCPNLVIRTNRCPCGKESYVYVDHGCVATHIPGSSYVDEYGHSHNVENISYTCGITQTRDSYTVFDGCYGTVYTHIILMYNDSVIYEANQQSSIQMHNFTYEYKFYGEIDCEAGYDAFGTCTICRETTEERDLRWHRETRVHIELTEYGACGGDIEQYSCPCGEISNAHVNIMCKDATHNNEAFEDESGHMHNIYTITCPDCGLVYTKDVYNPVVSGCETRSTVKQTITVNGATVEEIYSSELTESHNFTEEYNFYGDADCSHGYDIIRTCQICEEVRTESGYYSHDMRKYTNIELSEFSVCGGYIYSQACACGRNTNVNFYLPCAQYTSESINDDATGAQHIFIERYTCDSCGVMLVIETYTSADTGNEVKSYVLTVNDAHLFSQIVESYNNGCEGNHVYEKNVIDPTCNEEGYTQYICIRCKDMYTSDFTPTLGHNFENGMCTSCGMSESSSGGVIGCAHNFIMIKEMAPTCISEGILEYECEFCKMPRIESLPTAAHQYDENGICTVCSCVEAPKLDYCIHELITAEETMPTCTEPGYMMMYCSQCGYQEQNVTSSALGHTLTEDGICTMCGIAMNNGTGADSSIKDTNSFDGTISNAPILNGSTENKLTADAAA